MAHFAEIDHTGTVIRVVVVSNDDAPDPFPTRSEPAGRAFLASINLGGQWMQTSYNGTFRRRYAGIGMTYSAEHDAFIFPQPYSSWTLDLDDPGDWVPPIPMPTDEGYWYEWDEQGQQWIPHEIEQPTP
jgi:hypothetical protein